MKNLLFLERITSWTHINVSQDSYKKQATGLKYKLLKISAAIKTPFSPLGK